jgi:hypothetical protein
MSTAALTALAGALWGVVQGAGAVIAAVFGLLSLALSSWRFLLTVFAMIVVTVVAGRLQSKGAETVVEAMVTVAYPVYSEDIRPIAVMLVELLDPVLCWTNAATSYVSNVLRDVVFPTMKECGIRTIARDAVTFLKYVALDVVVFFANGSFMTRYADFSRISPAGMTLAQDWIDLYMCSCSDLGNIVRVAPILSPTLLVPPLWPLLIFSQEWTDSQTWCAISNAFNAFVALLQQAIRLAIQVINLIIGHNPPNTPFVRPDLAATVELVCQALHCAARSTENAYQLFWDTYVPFRFVWHEFLCVFDTLGCIALKTASWLFSVLVNIDKAVSYPDDDWWAARSKPQIIALINMWAAPTPFSPIPVPAAPAPLRYYMTTYYLNTSDPLTPDGSAPNPLYGQMRITECLCIFVDRIICDPADNSTACFSSGAQNLLMGLDFCCLGNTLGTTLADVAAASFEATLHFARGSDDFFLSLDAQPFTTQLAADLTSIAHCLFSVFGLIPTVGTCIQDLLVDVVQFALTQIDFVIRGLIGLASLPYFLIVLPDIRNFITAPDRALDYFVASFDALVADTPSSFKNCLCVILNYGFPIPPIPCSSCEVGGFIPPPPPGQGKRRRTLIDAGGPVGLLRSVWPNTQISNHITPLIRYDNHTSDAIQLFNMLWINVQTLDPKVLTMPNLRSVDAFVDRKKAELLERWGASKQCNARADELRRMARTEPRLYNWHKERGDFDGQCMHAPEQRMSAFEPFPQEIPTTAQTSSRQAPIVIGPTQPPVVGCNPTPQCFDLCCVFRTTLILLVQLITTTARFVNGLVQHDHTVLGTLQDFPYFTGEYANFGKATFESDIIAIIIDAFAPITCACDVLNLVIPVLPSAFSTGRPDICCAISYLAQLIAGIVQVIINVVNSLTMGASTGYAYFVHGQFMADVNTLFDLALLVINCICVFVRAVFPPDYIPGFADATDFDICCGVEVILDTFTEMLRLILQIIISLATITLDPNSYCYWRLDQTTDHQCAGVLDGIGVIVQIDRLLDTFFPQHTLGVTGQSYPLPDGTTTWVADDNPTSSGGACYTTCGIDNGAGGIVPCLCQLFNTLIPFRRFPDKKVNCSPDPELTNCQELDLCCGFAKIGFALSDLTKFTMRALVSLWQSWDGGLPEFFVHYIWCAEPYKVPCPQHQSAFIDPCGAQVNVQIPQCPGTHAVLDSTSTVQYRCGEFTCGKFNIVIADLTDPFEGLLSKCLCEIVGLLDTLIAFIFTLIRPLGGPHGAFEFATWSCCFCGGTNPIDGTCNRKALNACAGGIFAPFGGAQNPSGSGILPAVSYIADAILVASVRLTREFPLSCYWHPAPNGAIPNKVSETWIFSFLGPTADAAAIAVGNTMCILQSMFFLPMPSMPYGERFIGSTVRWGAEVAFRIIGFIEAFVESLVTPQYSCVGPSCSAAPGSPDQTESHGVSAKRLGAMLTILFSIPVDMLIGDSSVACTTVCPPFNANPPPDADILPFNGCIHSPVTQSCSCGCWNGSPMFGGSLQANAQRPYAWIVSNVTGVGSPCRDMRKSLVDAGIIQHVGLPFGRTDGCCALQYPVANTNFLPAFPVCQSPADSDLLYTTRSDPNTGVVTYEPSGFPGSCVYFSACRSDALPSIANDPMTPLGLSGNYAGAIDGLAMGFFRYLRSLLDHLFTCQTAQAPCDSTKQYGIVFYPAILVFSIVWQILGGVINFLAAVTVFFFSLFQPPSGSSCGCWNQGVTDHFGETRTQFYRLTAALCYPCRTIGMDCNTPVNWGPYLNDPRMALSYRCRPYCPAMLRLSNPALTAAQAMTACYSAWLTYTPKDFPTWSPNEVCNGSIGIPGPFSLNYVPPLVYYQYYPAYPLAQQTLTLPVQCNQTQNSSWSCYTGLTPQYGLCRGLGGVAGSLGGNDEAHYISLDLCPNPTCVDPAATISIGGVAGAPGFWPCGQGGGSVFDSTYPNNALVTCGVIQIVTNALAVFAEFTAIFTQPIYIPQKRDELFPARMIGPVRRESRQVFGQRMRAAHGPRFQGLVYGQQTGAPNLAWVMASAIYDYDISDCYSDPITCHCRNLDIPQYCMVDINGQVVYGPLGTRKRDAGNGTLVDVPMTTGELTAAISQEIFTGTTVCDHIVADVAGDDWDAVSMSQKHRFIGCSDKLIMGDRLNTIHDAIPTDIMYNNRAPLTLVSNLFGQARRRAQEEKRHQPRPHDESNDQGGGDSEDVRTDFERRFPNWPQQLAERTKFAQQVLAERYGMGPTRMMYSAILKADRLWFKYASGYYSWMARKAADTLANSTRTLLPSPRDALAHLHETTRELGSIIWNQPYRRLVDASVESSYLTARLVGNIYSEGTVAFATRNLHEYGAYRKSRMDHVAHKRVSRLAEALKWSPLVQWLWPMGNATAERRPSIFAPFAEHMQRVIAAQRKRWHETPRFSLWTADLHFWSFKDLLLKRWQNPVWRPGQRENWERLKLFALRLMHRFWPDVPLAIEPGEQRFIFDSNCPVVDKLVNLTVNTVEYCAAQTLINLRYENPSTHNPDSYFGYRHMPQRYRMEASVPGGWERPRLVARNASQQPRRALVDRQAYRAATQHAPMERHGPAGWTLIDWLVVVIEDHFNFNFHGTSDDWFAAVTAWLKNPNTSDSDRPDVGLLYWLRFEFICNFPTSYNCSYGIGFEWALWYTLAAFIIIAVLAVNIFPFSLLSVPLQLIGWPLAFAAVFFALGFGFPITCMVPVPFISTGFGVPECLPAQALAFADKYITNCYSPLIIPSYMIAGPLCPADGQIDVLDCRDVGVSDGITNLLFLGFWVFGSSFTNVVLQVTGTVLAPIIPGVREYMQLTLDAMVNANPTQMQRETFCFFATIYTMIPAIGVLIALAVVAYALLTPTLILLDSLAAAFMASPMAVIIPGANVSAWFPNADATPKGKSAAQGAQTTLVQRYLYGMEMQRKKRQ